MITFKYLLLICGASVLLSLLLTPLIRHFAPAFGLLDIPNSRKIHSKPIPRAGGLAIFFAFHLSLLLLFYLPLPHLRGYLDAIWWWHFFLLSTGLVFLGLLDDLLNLRARIKLLGQVAVAVGAYLCGIHFGAAMGIRLHPAMDLAITVFWFVSIINAFNLIDGMDGLACGLGIIGGIGLAGTLFIEHLNRDCLISMVLVGACLGFMRYNFHPATIFLGDTGSMFIGFTYGAIALSTGAKDTAITTLVVPALAVGIPLFDTFLAVWRRLARRFAPGTLPSATTGIMAADSDHLHHRLLKTGVPHKRAAVMLYVAALLLTGIGIASLLWQSCAIGIYTLAFAAGSYVVVRHIAHTELWASSAALLHGLTHPSRKSLMVVSRVPLDLAIATTSLLITRWLLFPGAVYVGAEYRAVTHFIIWVALPFLSLILFGLHRHAWSMASLMDFFLLQLATLFGIVMAMGLALLTTDITLRDILPEAVLYLGLLGGLWSFSRAFPRLLEETLVIFQHWHARKTPGIRRVILVGAGPECLDIIRHKSLNPPDEHGPRLILGLVDEDTNLLDRYIHGYRIIGLISQLEEVIETHGVHELVITRPLPPETEQALKRVARDKGVRVKRWIASFLELDAETH